MPRRRPASTRHPMFYASWCPWISHEGLLDTAFEQIRHYSKSDIAVSPLEAAGEGFHRVLRRRGAGLQRARYGGRQELGILGPQILGEESCRRKRLRNRPREAGLDGYVMVSLRSRGTLMTAIALRPSFDTCYGPRSRNPRDPGHPAC